MPRCRICSTISLETLLGNKPSVEHHASSDDLMESAKGCDLCALIMKSLEVELQRQGRQRCGQLKFYLGRLSQVWPAGISLITYESRQIDLDGVLKICAWTITKELEEFCKQYYTCGFRPWKPLRNPLDFVQDSLKRCQMEHGTKCWLSNSHPPQLPRELPTLALDISGEGNTVKLIETRPAANASPLRGEYCALSHAWGPPESKTRPVTTTKKNLAQHCRGILVSDLSRTFQDAIRITRSIGISYLWIDSLCILQDTDDLEDWKREASRMQSVYKHSYLTIAATGARDGSEGCMFLPDREDSIPLPLWDNEQKESPLFLRETPPKNPPYSWYIGPLQDRAWVTQEWILSPRLLHCCRSEFLWKCRESEVSESGTDYHLSGHEPHTGFEWREQVSQYSHRKLTKRTDRLVAMQGVLDEMSELFKSRFAFGISMDDPHRNLMWYIKSPSKQARPQELTELGIPSWSWKSVSGGIEYSPYSVDKIVSEEFFPGVEFLKQCSKELFVRCRHPFPLERTFSSLKTEEGYEPVRVFPDEEYHRDLDCEADQTPIFILPMILQDQWRKVKTYDCLLLTPTEEEVASAKLVFRRMGVVLRLPMGIYGVTDYQTEGFSDIVIC